MNRTSIMRRFQTSSVASAIFVVGTGIGWHFADLLIESDPAMPTLAAVRFEGMQPHEPYRGDATRPQPQYEAVREPAFRPQKGAVEPSQPQADADEERKLADALRWVDRYRERREAQQWDALAKNQQQMQRLAQAQGELIRAPLSGGERMVADTGTGAGKPPRIGPRMGEAVAITPAPKSGRTKRRVAHRAHTRVGHVRGSRREMWVCPLRWLQAMLTEPVMERRSAGRRQYRRTATG